jgi:solute carrier family 13 (sodium-dependent dicarboxylate transporter), member 2/3/5
LKISKSKIGLILGPLLFTFVLLFFHPKGLSKEANAILASALWIAIWWITEAVSISVTALLPIVLCMSSN